MHTLVNYRVCEKCCGKQRRGDQEFQLRRVRLQELKRADRVALLGR